MMLFFFSSTSRQNPRVAGGDAYRALGRHVDRQDHLLLELASRHICFALTLPLADLGTGKQLHTMRPSI